MSDDKHNEMKSDAQSVSAVLEEVRIKTHTMSRMLYLREVANSKTVEPEARHQRIRKIWK